MAHYNRLNVKLCNSQLINSKLGIKKWYWSNFHQIVINFNLLSNDEANFPPKSILTDRQVLRLR